MPGRFQGKVALITGAAGGIGLATARAFAGEGAAVTLADLGGQRVKEAAGEIHAAGGKATAIEVDVSDMAACEAMVAHTVDCFGTLDIAFNNAAIPSAPYAEFTDASLADWEKVISINLSSVFHAMQAEVPALKKAGGGAIINTASMMSFVTQPGMASYIAAKHGVAGLTKGAAMDLIRHGIRVNAICPGFVNTPMLAPALQDETQRAFIESLIPARRVGEADEVAKAVLFLASDDASYMVGALMRVDGGSTLN